MKRIGLYYVKTFSNNDQLNSNDDMYELPLDNSGSTLL